MRLMSFLPLFITTLPGFGQLHVSKGSELYLENGAFIAVYHDVQEEEKITGAGPIRISTEHAFKLIQVGELLERTAVPDPRMQFFIYPNPAHGSTILKISLLRPSKVNVHVYDGAGKQITAQMLSLEARETAVQLDLSALAPGAYFVTLDYPDGKLSRTILVR